MDFQFGFFTVRGHTPYDINAFKFVNFYFMAQEMIAKHLKNEVYCAALQGFIHFGQILGAEFIFQIFPTLLTFCLRVLPVAQRPVANSPATLMDSCFPLSTLSVLFLSHVFIVVKYAYALPSQSFVRAQLCGIRYVHGVLSHYHRLSP